MKKTHKIIWGICLFIIVTTSLVISFKLYNNSYGMGTLMLFGNARKIGIYKHEEIYSMVQLTNFMIMFFINVMGHTIEWGIGKHQNIHFYGITNITLCFTIRVFASYMIVFSFV